MKSQPLAQDKHAQAATKIKDQPSREARKTADSTLDRIWKYYHNKKTQVVLDVEEENIRERWEKAWYLLCRHRTLKETVSTLERLFSIKKSVAYDDVNNAMLIFGDPRADHKDAKRAIAETMALRAMKLAWERKDLESYHRFLKEYKELNNLNGDDDARMAELLRNQKPVSITFVTDRKTLELQAKELIKDVPAEDIAFEDVKEEK
ncbi:MAG: hypothetical protein WDO15_09965 [Bacteroidota bacterium]